MFVVYFVYKVHFSVWDFGGTDTDEQACVPLIQEQAKLHRELLPVIIISVQMQYFFSFVCVNLNVIEVKMSSEALQRWNSKLKDKPESKTPSQSSKKT